MSYTVLARKYRPKNFTEVAGQEHVLRALGNAFDQKRLHHAYLFSGTRGVGKTTIARIIAKCLNCEKGITATPCGICEACTEIDTGRFIDLLEIDAASRTKVEDTRDLLDNVQYLPAKGRFKVYLIDEVHMLSGHSFNALLKTLEEPPEHVKFLLATTDPQRLPATVLSRCLQFNLKALTPELIQKQLAQILENEKIAFEPQALHQLAVAANGSVRDALSLLDQAIAYSHGKISTIDVNAMLGTVDTTKIFSLLEALVANNATAMLDIITELNNTATDFTTALEEVLNILHHVAIIQAIKNVDASSWINPELLQKLAKLFTPDETQLYYQLCLLCRRDLPLAPTPKIGFEMAMLRMLAFRPQSINPINTSIPKTEENILKQIKVTGPTQALLNHCIIKKMDQTSAELLLEPNQAPMLNKKHEERLTQAFSDYFKRPITVTISLGTTNMDTIANTAVKSIQNDNTVQALVNKFDAKIIPNSITHEDIK